MKKLINKSSRQSILLAMGLAVLFSLAVHSPENRNSNAGIDSFTPGELWHDEWDLSVFENN